MTLLEIKQKIRYYTRRAADGDTALQTLVGILKNDVPHYTGVYIYMLEPDRKTLKLTHFEGRPTQHTRIPVDKGVCGAAVREAVTVVVPDVSADERYLACSLETKSEVVVPIFKDGKVIGEIDIDSDELDPFTEADTDILEFAAATIAQRIPVAD